MAGHERETNPEVGYGRSDAKTFTIPNGNTGANIGQVDLGRNYAYIVLRCTNCQYIQASTTLGVKAAMDENQALCSIYEYSGNILTLLAPTLPYGAGVTMQTLLVPVFGAQFIHFTLSKPASGGSVVFEVYGLAESVKG